MFWSTTLKIRIQSYKLIQQAMNEQRAQTVQGHCRGCQRRQRNGELDDRPQHHASLPVPEAAGSRGAPFGLVFRTVLTINLAGLRKPAQTSLGSDNKSL